MAKSPLRPAEIALSILGTLVGLGAAWFTLQALADLPANAPCKEPWPIRHQWLWPWALAWIVLVVLGVAGVVIASRAKGDRVVTVLAAFGVAGMLFPGLFWAVVYLLTAMNCGL